VLARGKRELLFEGGWDIECYRNGIPGFRANVAHAQPKETFDRRDISDRFA
jgi:hypothetical protein